MAAGAQPQGMSFDLGYLCGFQQIGDQMFVTMQIAIGTLSVTVAMPVEAAKIFSRKVKEAAESAEVQVIKPPSMLASN